MADKFDMPEDVLGKRWEEEAAARRIWFPGRVNEGSILALCIWLKKLSLESAEDPIELILSTQGGSSWAAAAGIGAIDICPAPVHGLALGHVMSAGVYLLAICDQRRANRYARFMIHSCIWDENGTTILEKEIAAAEMQAEDTRYCWLLGQQTQRDQEFWASILSDGLDHYFSPEEALDWGLVDEIL